MTTTPLATTKEIIGYKNLFAWQIANQLAKEIYKITISFPKQETYGITSQIRRAALSVPLNIVEGYARNSRGEFKQFLKIALGSLAETGYLLEFANEQKLIKENDYQRIMLLKERCGSLLWKLFIAQK